MSSKLLETKAPPPEVVIILFPLKLSILSLPNEPQGLSYNFEPMLQRHPQLPKFCTHLLWSVFHSFLQASHKRWTTIIALGVIFPSSAIFQSYSQ